MSVCPPVTSRQTYEFHHVLSSSGPVRSLLLKQSLGAYIWLRLSPNQVPSSFVFQHTYGVCAKQVLPSSKIYFESQNGQKCALWPVTEKSKKRTLLIFLVMCPENHKGLRENCVNIMSRCCFISLSRCIPSKFPLRFCVFSLILQS